MDGQKTSTSVLKEMYVLMNKLFYQKRTPSYGVSDVLSVMCMGCKGCDEMGIFLNNLISIKNDQLT